MEQTPEDRFHAMAAEITILDSKLSSLIAAYEKLPTGDRDKSKAAISNLQITFRNFEQNLDRVL